jgi:hypothetical protein
LSQLTSFRNFQSYKKLKTRKMKITKIFLLTFLLGVLAITSCQKKGCTDTSATNYDSDAKDDDGTCTFIPIITLIGNDTVKVTVGGTYTDAGATAANQDGTSVTVTTDQASVNTAQTGSYSVTYTATNDYGSVTATRTVNVVVSQGVWTSGTWNIVDNCGTTSFPLSSPPTVGAGATASDLEFTSFFSLVGGTANATISGESITFLSQTIALTGGDVTFTGTGTMNSAGTEYVIDFTYDNTVPVFGGAGTCTATYTLQ